ncbi:phosphatase PAP2 family protein [Terrabacter sp. MAHUQ-38]|uniref:phosphatase PAP2 family protein n=1 Tax=unclassified Terrabacter TaxID=2630222 RepID=UPI00165DB4E2|nr:phosphatase PAP2 family protein [Terrabacter sp. MAHUQ-38]MBC9820717.1 phosphatase PAP2 family protein [Terrabacter sp. MAHUQ-38]
MNDTFVHRYESDASRPTVGAALRDAALRVLAPAVVLFGAIVGLGLLIVGPFHNLPWEKDVSRDAQSLRTSTWDAVTMVWSHIGNTEIIIGVCIVVVALVWWRTKQWWYAVVPAIAIAAQASVFVAATTIVGRDRPKVEHLDPAPPTSSYPSGHVGAATALYLTFAFMAQRIERAWLRRLVTVICLVIPFLVASARLYRGMHSLTDIVIGALNGLICALLAWHYLRRRSARDPAAGREREALPR